MPKKPGFYFYVADWQRDTRRLDPAIKGHWIDLLCFMHDAPERGTLDWPIDDYACALGISKERACEVISELLEKGTADGFFCSKTDGKPIANAWQTVWQNDSKTIAKLSNRRMVRERENKQRIQQLRKSAGEKGAKKRWQKWHSSYSYSNFLNINNPSIVSPEKNSKKEPDKEIPFREFTDFFCQRFETTFGVKYHFRKAKDAQTVKRLLSVHSLDKLQELVIKFFTTSDAWIKKSGYSLGVFESQINKLSINQDPGDVMKRWAERHSK